MKFWIGLCSRLSEFTFCKAHTATSDNGKVRPFHNQCMVLFVCSLFVQHTHLILDMSATQFGWLSHGKCLKLLVEGARSICDDDHGTHTLLALSSHPPRLSCPPISSRCKFRSLFCLIVVCLLQSLTHSSSFLLASIAVVITASCCLLVSWLLCSHLNLQLFLCLPYAK